MNAIPSGPSKVCEDAEILIQIILHFDPAAAHAHSKVFPEVRAKLLSWGWSQRRFEAAVQRLRSTRGLFLSNSRKTISLKPLSQSNSWKNRCCAYCGKTTKKLTKDHVIPKAQGGSNRASNIVWACKTCNLAKADRTPDEWANDILNYHKRAS